MISKKYFVSGTTMVCPGFPKQQTTDYIYIYIYIFITLIFVASYIYFFLKNKLFKLFVSTECNNSKPRKIGSIVVNVEKPLSTTSCRTVFATKLTARKSIQEDLLSQKQERTDSEYS